MAAKLPKQPTLRTISELSGLAIPTVSRALNNAPDIGAKTKSRVHQIARDIGYVPNRAGLRLRTGKTNVISLVLGTDNEVTDHTGQLVSSIARALRDTRYHMIVTPYFPQEDPLRPVRYIVETRSADAVILNRIETVDARIDYLTERGFPFVTYGRTDTCAGQPFFDFDNMSFGRIAAQTLIRAGRRRIALLAPPLQQSYAQHMLTGAQAVLNGAGLSLDVIAGINSDDAGHVLRDGVAGYLGRMPQTDGLICPSTTAAIAAVVGCERQGRVIGETVDVFAKEAIPFLEYFRPQLKSVIEDVAEAGTFLARAAIQAIEQPDLPPLQRLVEAKPIGDPTGYTNTGQQSHR